MFFQTLGNVGDYVMGVLPFCTFIKENGKPFL